MAKPKRYSRRIIAGLLVVLVAGVLTAAFWPRPVLVDFGTVTKGPLIVTIDEEGRTQVSEPYIVATPIAGRLQRVQVHPGEPVVRGETIVAHMLPTNPVALDVRTREQGQAAVSAATASLRVAEADLSAAKANRDLAQSELARTKRLFDSQISSQAALDRAEQNARVAEAAVDVAKAAIAIREADVAKAQALLIGLEDPRLAAAVDQDNSDSIPLYAPADGRILRIMQESETTLPAGAPIMEIGNIEDDLEIIVDLISSDAVKVQTGNRVIIEGWGGDTALSGTVHRVDPFGVTKVSALGVEEQRVPLTIALTSDPSDFKGLGHGFRVEVRIVIWESENTLQIPTSALFRNGSDWATFVERDGAAQMVTVQIGHSNGISTEVSDGVTEGDSVILYPSAAIEDQIKIAKRNVN